MSLLAKLAAIVGGLNEPVGTEALGAILASDEAGKALTTKLRSYFPQLPSDLHFSTQAHDGSTRPDVVGTHQGREVLHIEGKYWASLTNAQREGKYLARLAQKTDGADCRGILLWVCPFERAENMWTEVSIQSEILDGTTDGQWRYGHNNLGQGVALVDWHTICRLLENDAPSAAEDVRQLAGLINLIQSDRFVPWTREQITDQDSPLRIWRLGEMLNAVVKQIEAKGLSTAIKSEASMSYPSRGWVLELGGVMTKFQISPSLQHTYGISPWWLRWPSRSKAIAEMAFADCHDPQMEMRPDTFTKGCCMPVPLEAGAEHDAILEATVNFLLRVGEVLRQSNDPGESVDSMEADQEPFEDIEQF